MNECIIFSGAKDKDGYGKMKRGGKCVKAHRQAYLELKGSIPEGMIVCHSCDNPSCINAEHLFLGTHKDNSDDKISKGRDRYADQSRHKNGNAILNESDISEIRSLISQGMTNKKIAEIFRVTHQNISCIKLGKSWN